MPFGGPYTQLPKEFSQIPINVPNASMTALTTVDTEIAQITLVNTTAGALTITIQDTQATPLKYLAAQSIAANAELLLSYDPPTIFKGGIQWQASATGITGTLRGRSIMNLALGAATAQTAGLPVPV